MNPIELPTLSPAGEAQLSPEQIERLQSEVRALAEERSAVILAHNYQVPEVQDVAHFVGDSLGLSRQAAATNSDVIAFCGVHFMAETASILSPEKTVLLPDLDAGCSLADSITADQLRAVLHASGVGGKALVARQLLQLEDAAHRPEQAIVGSGDRDASRSGLEVLVGDDVGMGVSVALGRAARDQCVLGHVHQAREGGIE